MKESTFWNTRIAFDKHILPALGKLRIKNISVTACQKQANKWAKNHPNRYYRYINYAGIVFKYAVATEEIKSDPMSKISMPSPEQTDEDEIENFYDRKNLIYFLDEMKNKHPFKRYAFFLLLAYTGLRKGEAMVLTWRDIDFKNSTLTVNKLLL